MAPGARLPLRAIRGQYLARAAGVSFAARGQRSHGGDPR
jgi:hypothetical protein